MEELRKTTVEKFSSQISYNLLKINEIAKYKKIKANSGRLNSE
ncbi:MAG: hypothetical protein RL059_141 [Bacteroidota bacterium]|jgi:hypothetical protein